MIKRFLTYVNEIGFDNPQLCIVKRHTQNLSLIKKIEGYVKSNKMVNRPNAQRIII